MSELPYKRSETFIMDGQPYTSEEKALRAAVERALGNAGLAGAALGACVVLAPLLARAAELGLGNKPPVAKES